MNQAEPSADAFVRFVDDVRRFVRHRVDDPTVQEDLVQEVFLRVHDRREQLRDEERMAGWIRRIASNVVVDHHRRRRLDTGELPEAIADDEADDDTAWEDERALMAAWLAATVHTLDPQYAEVLTLTELQGLTQREAAERLGLSLPAIKSRVRRGRAALMQRLQRCCHVELDHRGALMDYTPRTPCQARHCCPADDA